MLMELLIIFYSVFNEDLVSLFPDAVTVPNDATVPQVRRTLSSSYL